MGVCTFRMHSSARGAEVRNTGLDGVGWKCSLVTLALSAQLLLRDGSHKGFFFGPTQRVSFDVRGTHCCPTLLSEEDDAVTGARVAGNHEC